MQLILERYVDAYIARQNLAIFHSWQYQTFLQQSQWLNQIIPVCVSVASDSVDFRSVV